MEKLIVTIALTGNVPTKELNESTPVTTDEIVSDAKACAELGASVAHIHVRDENGMPTSRRDLFEKVVNGMNEEKIDIIKQLSTGARGGENTVDWRGQMLDLNVEMASLATGSSNFPSSVNANSPDLIKELAQKMLDNNIKPEIEIFDTAMLSNALFLEKKGILKGPLHFNLVMDVKGSLPGTPRNLMFLVESLPKGSTWTVSGIGRSQVQMITMAIALGGHVRTGLEDTIEFEKGIAATNKMLVQRVVDIAKAVGRPIATTDEARKILNLV
ncbi:3-keto-5-aminohexanoate cleavage protein [Gudongella sp. DL1XJH-153]|uniref:3-keto-5-aminohexanoate cleavage protein n=1 Tax=Gudongella sp. DL1XJH-153 TaxID=3409804 RepID=UPI003BB5DF8A